jgi:2-polyprenyl-3-methyl-5-hydroxy-6-metoxy-1,4-benzoquinol methylase
MLFRTVDDPRMDRTTDIEILFCENCFHGFHGTGDDVSLVQQFYGTGEYKVSYFGQSNSLRIPKIAKYICNLKHQYPINSVLEVGCGMGEVLSILSEDGIDCTGVDMNPAVKKLETRPNLHFECSDILNYRPTKQFDLILARLFLEHVDEPKVVLELLKDFSTPTGLIVLEVPNATGTLTRGNFFEYYHEHRQYYSVTSMRHLLALVGYEVKDIYFNSEDTIMIIVAQLVDHLMPNEHIPGNVAKRVDFRELMSDFINNIEGARKTLWWGAGFTGVRILNSLPPNLWKKITLVDGDPNKQGQYVPFSKMHVDAPPSNTSAGFDFVFIASISSAKEIKAILRSRGFKGPVTYLASHGDTLFVTDTV